MNIDKIMNKIESLDVESLCTIKDYCIKLIDAKNSEVKNADYYINNSSLLNDLSEDQLLKLCKENPRIITLIDDIKKYSKSFISEIVGVIMRDSNVAITKDLLDIYFKDLDTELLDLLFIDNLTNTNSTSRKNIFHLENTSDSLKESIINFNISRGMELTDEMLEFGITDDKFKEYLSYDYYNSIPKSCEEQFKRCFTSKNVKKLTYHLSNINVISREEAIELIVDNIDIELIGKHYVVDDYELYKKIINKNILFVSKIKLSEKVLTELYYDTETKNKVLEFKELQKLTNNYTYGNDAMAMMHMKMSGL